MTQSFYKTIELNGSNYVKISVRSSAVLCIENGDKFYFLRLILARLHPCGNSQSNRVSKYRQKFVEIRIDGFDIAYGFECSDVHKIEKLKHVSMKMFEL